METIYLYFVKEYTYKKISLNKIFGWVINLFTWGKYFHVGSFESDDIENPKAFVIESQAPAGGAVRTYLSRYNHSTLIDIYSIRATEEQRNKYFEYMYEHTVNKTPYDYKGALGCVLRCIKQDKNKEFCSEVIVNACKYAGIMLDISSKASPNALSRCKELTLYKSNVQVSCQ